MAALAVACLGPLPKGASEVPRQGLRAWESREVSWHHRLVWASDPTGRGRWFLEGLWFRVGVALSGADGILCEGRSHPLEDQAIAALRRQ